MTFRPNNTKPAADDAPPIVWNDEAILTVAGEVAGQPPRYGSVSHAETIRGLFARHKFKEPTYWAVVQWVRRSVIPDRWRPTLVYMLMADQTLKTAKLFRRAPRPAPAPAPTPVP